MMDEMNLYASGYGIDIPSKKLNFAKLVKNRESFIQRTTWELQKWFK